MKTTVFWALLVALLTLAPGLVVAEEPGRASSYVLAMEGMT